MSYTKEEWQRKTRSGLVYGTYAANPIDELPKAVNTDAKACSNTAKLLEIMQSQLKLVAKNVDTTTGNVAGLLAFFAEGTDQALVDLYAYSSSAKMHPDTAFGRLNLVGKAPETAGEFSTQANEQLRNHTEPKLVQEFADRYLYEESPFTKNLKWVCVVTDRQCCTNCRKGTIDPFDAWCKKHGVMLYVYNLEQSLSQATLTVKQETTTSSSSASSSSTKMDTT